MGTSAQNKNIFGALRRFYHILTPQQKRKFGWLVCLTFLGSVSDLVGLGLIIPIVGLVLSPPFYQEVTRFIPAFAGLGKEQLLIYSVLAFFVLIVLKNAFGLYINYLQVRFVRNLYRGSTANVLNRIFQKPYSEILSVSSNTWVNKVTTLQAVLCSSLAISLMIIINEGIVFGLTAIIVCAWNWQLFLLLITVLLPSVGLFYYRVKNMIKHAGDNKNKNFISLYARAQEMIFGYADIKIAGTEKNFKERFRTLAKDYSNLQAKLDFTMFIPTRLIEIAVFLCIIIILVYGVFVLKDLNQLVTTITLFSVIAYRTIPSVNRFLVAMNTVNSSDFIFEDSDFIPDMTISDEEEVVPLPFEKEIHFEQVSYTYPGSDKPVICNNDLRILKGDKIGIVGKSGTGKSTLVNMILGFLHPTKGRIMVDDVELNAAILQRWWKMVGYVKQDAFILNLSFAENIALGEAREDIQPAKLEHAIHMSSLAPLVAELPNGVDTILSERGNNLSGGQKQRIAIARAIYKGARVLIFDEATSALDTTTEEEITNAINELGSKDLTIIIIAHRYSSLRFCEKIYEIEKGSLSNTLSYGELIKSGK